MGKLIVCTGKIGEEPYYFPLTNAKVYSIEELCYYIYNNIYNITEDVFQESLARWIEKELAMEETAKKLIMMMKEKKSLKDMVVTVLCSADYYEEQEIRDLIVIMNQLEKMGTLERKKLRGDNFLKYKDYGNAKKVYEDILRNKDAEKISMFQWGDILHNLGIAKIHCSSYEDAAMTFQSAYEKNENEKSLRAALLSFYLERKDDKYKEKIEYYEVEQEIAAAMSNEFEIAMIEAEELQEYQNIKKLKELKESGQMEEYYKRLDNTVSRWKEEYKNGIL